MATVECRNGVPLQWLVKSDDGFQVRAYLPPQDADLDDQGGEEEQGKLGTVFRDLDLSEGEWAEYCERIEVPVGIAELESRVEKQR